MLILGIIFGIVSATFDSLGFVIQKKGHMEAAQKKTCILKVWTWILGQVCTIMAVPFLLVALNLSSLTALSFVPGLAIFFIIVWSRLILKIELTIFDFLALGFLVPGIVVILIFSAIKKQDLNSWELGKYLFSPGAIAFVTIMGALGVSIGMLVYKILTNFNHLNSESREVSPNSEAEYNP